MKAAARSYLGIFANRRIIVTLFLGFSSGLPLGLSGTALQAWYTKAGIQTDAIGFLTLLGLPYVLKFVWAPLMDRIIPPMLGRRRGWMLVTQIALLVAIAGMGVMDPVQMPLALAAMAMLVAFLSASQDISFNAYMTDLLLPRERGFGAAAQVWGYRGAMLVSGGLTLIIADVVGWHISYFIMAALMGVGICATLFGPRPNSIATPPRSLRETVIEPFSEFLSRRNALALLALVILYKMGDAFAASLTSTFLLRGLGFTLTDVGGFYKLVSVLTTLLGVFFGGAILSKLGLFKAMFLFGVLQSVGILCYMALALVGKDYLVLFGALVCEHLAWGMGTAALMALLMALCNPRYTATQFALLSALDAIGRVFAGPLAGGIQAAIGWTGFYAASASIALPGLVLLWFLRKRVTEIECERALKPEAETVKAIDGENRSVNSS